MELGKKIILFTLLFGISQFPLTANAYLVWSQKIDNPYFTHISNNFYDHDSIAADDFFSSSDAEISIVNWHGAVGEGDNNLLHGFWIRFYSNNGAAPESLLYEEYVPMEDILFVDGDHASYTANLATATFLALADTTYWFSVQADTLIKYTSGSDDHSGWWGWTGDYTTILNPAFDIPYGPTSPGSSFYFELSNPVPIPGAVWLLGSGLIGLGVLRRKKGSPGLPKEEVIIKRKK